MPCFPLRLPSTYDAATFLTHGSQQRLQQQPTLLGNTSMDSWGNNNAADPTMSNSADVWEDWLRWDPVAEPMSPGSSTKESGGSTVHDPLTDGEDSFAWLKGDATIDPAFVVNYDSAVDMSLALGTSALDFAAVNPAGPYIFGSDDNLAQTYDTAPAAKESVVHWPSIEVQPPVQPPARTSSLANNAGAAANRRVSSSTVNTSDGYHHSPASNGLAQSSASSLSPPPAAPPKKKPGRKRKSEVVNQDSSSPADGEPPVKKTSHNVIEKRYRNNLNDKIVELRDSVPSLRAMSKPNGEEDGSEDLEGLTPAHKLNKSTIMAKATEYIRHLEKRNKSLSDDMDSLKMRLRTLEQAFARSSGHSDSHANAYGSPVSDRSRQSSTGAQPMSADPTTLDDLQQGFGQQDVSFDSGIDSLEVRSGPIVEQQQNGSNTNFMGKLMLGSMAGLMTMESFFEHDQSGNSAGDRGLAAMPMSLLRRSLSSSSTGASPYGLPSTLPLLKFFLLLSCLAYLASPLFRTNPKKKASAIPLITLTAAPSLASPVETRRKAWLTAIQSVWTPRPFLLEVVAVTVRMIELSLRRIVGFHRYAELLGMSEEDEAARIKAWDIAIDAQLAGGDAEVSYYRLLLTLMASGTLPDSPIRLMQKAVHFRIFFWEVANAGYGNMFMFKAFTAKVARIYWESARKQQKALVSGTTHRVDELDRTIERLPEHLAALIELECDDVLTDDIIQRAYNLAWNRPSAEKTIPNPTLDRVVEDPSIRSPLDAVAAWFTNTVIDEALALSVQDDESTDKELSALARLATSIAPPASSTLTRAHITQAILLHEDRQSSIAATLESMPRNTPTSPELGRSPTTGHLNVVDHVPLSAEVRTALTLAKLLSMCDRGTVAPVKSRAAAMLSRMSPRTTHFSLLTAVAAHKLLHEYTVEPTAFASGKPGFEQLAYNLRLWIGTRVGRSAGFSSEEKGCIIERCLAVTKAAGGWRVKDDLDSGYGSSGSRRGSEELAL